MIIFVSPGQRLCRLRGHDRLVQTLPDLMFAAISRRPEHARARAMAITLNHQAQEITRLIRAALPPELQEFWAAYTSSFALFSVGPLLANKTVAEQILAEDGPQDALLLESWLSRGFWTQCHNLDAAIAFPWRDAGGTIRLQPGPLWRLFRRWTMPWLARSQAFVERQRLRRQLRAYAPAPPVAKPCDVLWLAAGASSIDLLAPLYQALSAEGLRSGIVDLGFYGSTEALQRYALDFTPFWAFLCHEDFAAATALPLRLSMADLESRVPPLPSLTPAQQRALLERLCFVLRRDFPVWHLRALVAARVLAAFRPRVLIAFHTNNAETAPLIIAARRLGLPSLSLQHGVIGPSNLAVPTLPFDEILVWGPSTQQILLQAAPQQRITITGNPLYDTVDVSAGTPSEAAKALRQRAKGLVVLCTQYNEHLYYDTHRWWIAAVAETCRSLGVRLVLKLHPAEPRAHLRFYRTLLRPNEDSVILVPHGQIALRDLLAACDLMITRDSTVVFEANLLGRPVLTINLGDTDECFPYAATGGAVGIYRYEDIAPAIIRLLTDEAARTALAAKRDEFLAQHLGPRDRRATQRIVEIVRQWAHGQRKPLDTST